MKKKLRVHSREDFYTHHMYFVLITVCEYQRITREVEQLKTNFHMKFIRIKVLMSLTTAFRGSKTSVKKLSWIPGDVYHY